MSCLTISNIKMVVKSQGGYNLSSKYYNAVYRKSALHQSLQNIQHRCMELKLKNCTATRSPHVIEDASRSRPCTGTLCCSADI